MTCTRLPGLIPVLAVMLSLATPAGAAEKLEQAWRMEGFSNPESALYDAARDVVYVSNLAGAPTDKDGNGFVSRVSIDGEATTLQWVTGLDAPKGMAVVGDRLYVADIDTLVEIDTATGAVTARYPVADAKFMNDVATDGNGTVFVSDTGSNRIYRLAGGRLETWLEDAALDAPNGLLVEKDRILVGAMGSFEPGKERPGQLLSVSLPDRSVHSASGGRPVGHLDGVEAGDGGGYLLTDWPGGKLLALGTDGSITTLHVEKAGTADLDHVPEKGLILLPLMMENALLALRYGKK